MNWYRWLVWVASKSVFCTRFVFSFFCDRLATCTSSLAALGWESLLIFSQFEFPKQTISLLLKPNYWYISPLPHFKPIKVILKYLVHLRGKHNFLPSPNLARGYILTTQKLEFHVWIRQRNMRSMLTEDGVEKCHLKCNKSGWRNFSWLLQNGK